MHERLIFLQSLRRKEFSVPASRTITRRARIQQLDPRGWSEDSEELFYFPLSDTILSVPLTRNHATAAEAEQSIRSADRKISREHTINVITSIAWTPINTVGRIAVAAITGKIPGEREKS